jgi:hypothetical protein
LGKGVTWTPLQKKSLRGKRIIPVFLRQHRRKMMLRLGKKITPPALIKRRGTPGANSGMVGLAGVQGLTGLATIPIDKAVSGNWYGLVSNCKITEYNYTSSGSVIAV